jgi:HEAT repeat protein
MIRAYKIWRLKHQLKSIDFNIRRNASRMLGELKDANAIYELIDALKPHSGNWNDCAAWALGEIGDHSAVQPLIETIRSNPPNPMMENVITALGKLGDEKAVQPLVKLIEYDPRYNKVVIESLKRISSYAVSLVYEQQLMKLTQSDSYLTDRTDAANLLMLLKWEPKNPQEMVYFLITQKKWKEAASLGVDAVQPLVNIYYKGEKKEGQSEIVKKLALDTLSSIQDTNATAVLISLLDKYQISSSVANALSEIAKQDRSGIIEQLIAAMSSENIEIRSGVAKMLTDLGWIPEGDEVRAQFAVALRPWKRKLILSAGIHCVKYLTPFLRDSQLSKRAAELLNKLNWQPSNTEEHILYVIALEDVEAIVKFGNLALNYLIDRLNCYTIGWISTALVQIGDERAIEPLTKLIERTSHNCEDFSYNSDIKQMQIALDAIAQIGGSDAAQVLFRFAHDKYKARYATHALEQLLSLRAESVPDNWLQELANIENLTVVEPTGQLEYSNYYENYLHVYGEVPIIVDQLRTLASSELDQRPRKSN